MKTRHTTRFSLLLAAFLTLTFVAPAAFAQQQQNTDMRDHGKMHGAMKHRGKMMKELMPPRMILKHGDAIGLTVAQRTEITKIVDESNKNTERLQTELQTESDKLTPLLAAAKPDTNAALRQADRVFAAENKLKRAHLETMLRTKNVLTAEQINKIETFKKDRAGRHGDKKHRGKGKHKNHQNIAE